MSDALLDGNGNGNGDSPLTDTLILTYNRQDGTFTIGGKAVNNEVALEMCNRAGRYFETQLHLMAAVEARQKAAADALVAGVARDVANRRH